MLLARDEREAADLRERCRALRAAGQEAQFLDAGEAMRAEPALVLPLHGAALLVPQDAQLVRPFGLRIKPHNAVAEVFSRSSGRARQHYLCSRSVNSPNEAGDALSSLPGALAIAHLRHANVRCIRVSYM